MKVYPPAAWLRLPVWIVLAAVLAALFAVFPYTTSQINHLVPLTQAAWLMWMNFPDFQHGMLVAPLAGFLAWRLRARLAALPREGSWTGLPVLGFAFLLFLVGFLADIQYLGFVSLNFLVAGLILWFCGREWMRTLGFPWVFLFFMWPMPFLDNLVAFPLRMMMSQGSHLILSALGLANERIGTAVVSAARPGWPQGARFAIDVADPCSGIRSLFALLMISALYGYFAADRTWKKWVIFLAAVPLAVAGNMVRILLLTFGTLLWGSRFAIGSLDEPTWFHLGAGYVVFGVALLGMLGVTELLNTLARSLPVLRSQFSKPIQAETPPCPPA